MFNRGHGGKYRQKPNQRIAMKERVKIVKVLPLQSGTSQSTGNEWHKQSYIGEYYYDDARGYKKRILFDVFGKDRIEAMSLQEGGWYDVQYDIDVREYKDRYFVQISAYGAVPVLVDSDEPL